MNERPDIALQRAVDFERRSVELVAGSVRPIEAGWVIETPELPEVWSLNHVRIAAPVSYEQAIALCHEHHPERSRLHLHIEHDRTGERLAEQFRADGWEAEVNLHLVLGAEAGRRTQCAEVIEAEEDEVLRLMARWINEDETLELTADSLRQVLAHNRDVWRARAARRLGVRLASGELAAMTLLFSDGVIAQVEDVYAVPEARGRGYGRRLVSRAVELALAQQHELVFIVADDDSWPKELYRSVGFEPVGRSWLFHRNLAVSKAAG